MQNLTRAEGRNVLVWMYATPVIACWATVSFAPLIALFVPDTSALSTLGDIFFLATGFLGLGALFLFAVFSAKPEYKSSVKASLRGRAGELAAYATLWLLAYSAFKFFV